MEPLVRLGPALDPAPGARTPLEGLRGRLADHVHAPERARLDETAQQVTADDVEFAWKRVLSPRPTRRSPRSSWRSAGAAAYHRVRGRCTELADAVGVEARGRYTFVVRLAFPQPWFVASVARPRSCRSRARRSSDTGTTGPSLGKIVTDGAFALAA